MVKQSLSLMNKFFSRERFGGPQVLAGALLLAFVAQCAWLVVQEYRGAVGATEDEFARIEEGLGQWRGMGVAGTPSIRSPLEPASAESLYDRTHSPLWYLIAAAPVAVFRVSPDGAAWFWLTRAPYILFGALLGASLWYVSRRLYGNAGGFIALGLYCFSPAVIRSSALWVSAPNVAGAWGTFGAVFTAIAVSHTLYAPREVVLWNWRRIILLGVAIALAVGSQFSLAVILLAMLAFMFYLAPERKAAVIAILAAAFGVGLLLVFAAYFFHPATFFNGLRHAQMFDVSWRSAGMGGDYLQLLKEIAGSGPVLVMLIPAALITYIVWRRARYFGNSAPLIVAALFLLLRLLAPHDSGSAFGFTAVIFIFVFVAGIAADLLETEGRELVLAVFVSLVAANALWDLLALVRIGR